MGGNNSQPVVNNTLISNGDGFVDGLNNFLIYAPQHEQDRFRSLIEAIKERHFDYDKQKYYYHPLSIANAQYLYATLNDYIEERNGDVSNNIKYLLSKLEPYLKEIGVDTTVYKFKYRL